MKINLKFYILLFVALVISFIKCLQLIILMTRISFQLGFPFSIVNFNFAMLYIVTKSHEDTLER